MFKKLVLDTLGKHASNERLIKSIVRYGLRLTTSIEMKKIANNLGILEEVNSLKKDQLDYSQYILQHLWRAVHAKSSKNNELRQKYYHVLDEDIEFCLEFLSKDDLLKINQKWDNLKHLSLDTVDVNNITNRVKKFCDNLANQVRFLFTYDNGLTRDDFVATMLQEVIRICRLYEHSQCKNLYKCKDDNLEKTIEKYILKSLGNIKTNLIEYYTCESRARITTEENPYRKRKNLLSKLNPIAKEKFGKIYKDLTKEERKKLYDSEQAKPIVAAIKLAEKDTLTRPVVPTTFSVDDPRNAKILMTKLSQVELEIRDADFYSTTYSIDTPKDDSNNKIIEIASPDSYIPYNTLESEDFLLNVKNTIEDTFWLRYHGMLRACKIERSNMQRKGLAKEEIRRKLIEKGFKEEDVKQKCFKEIEKEIGFINAISGEQKEFQKHVTDNNLEHLGFYSMCKEARKFFKLEEENISFIKRAFKEANGGKFL